MVAHYMLDTDTAGYIIKRSDPTLDRRVASVALSDICISSVTRAELLYGVHRKPGAHHLARVVTEFLATIESLPWDDEAADRFGMVAAELDAAGARIGTFDTMIAAHAIATGAVIVTNNVGHFSRVSGVTAENWTSGAKP